MTRARVFVDGAAGTVGLALHPYLGKMLADGVIGSVSVLVENMRKNMEHREAAMAEADIVVLCLPDDAAREAVARVRHVNPTARILDASASHRVRPGWIYGLPELHQDGAQVDLIQDAQFVANPGCFATACILLAKPLCAITQQQALKTRCQLPWMLFQGITGYSAGNRVLRQRSSGAHHDCRGLVSRDAGAGHPALVGAPRIRRISARVRQLPEH